METGKLFNIQKFSIHDGPGVRTTVFLKGCPLKCRWCSNPESQELKTQILFNRDKCVKCLSCISVCPNKLIKMDSCGNIVRDLKRCTSCMKCVNICPERALSSDSFQMTSSDVLDVCMQDKDFYDESGGGVTISGGEGMLQHAFTKELALLLKENKVHTAIETTGCVDENIFNDLIKVFDLLLFDVKHYNSERHKEGTGQGNELILKNLEYALLSGTDVLLRIPIIPGFNASPSDAEGFAELFTKLQVKRTQLLPFHQMGQRKYEFLQRSYDFEDKKALHDEDLDEYIKIFKDRGIDAFV